MVTIQWTWPLVWRATLNRAKAQWAAETHQIVAGITRDWEEDKVQLRTQINALKGDVVDLRNDLQIARGALVAERHSKGKPAS